MTESSKGSKVAERGFEQRWRVEKLTEARLNALLPYTEFETIDEFKETLVKLSDILARMPSRNNRNRFLPRYGGPTKWEYVLYGQGRLIGQDFATVKRCLEDLGIATLPIDELDREFVVVQERGKTTLELLSLVVGIDPDEDMSDMQGANWGAIASAAMEKAAQQDSSEDIPVVQRNYRSFPLNGSDKLQRLQTELRRHFMDATRPDETEGDPADLDALISDTAIRFEDGSISLDNAFNEWGLEVEESTPDERLSVPSGKLLGEVLEPGSSRSYRWRGGVLYKKGPNGFSDAIVVPKEDLFSIYARAKPAAELLWQADSLDRKAERILTFGNSYRQGTAQEIAAKWRAEALEKREQADAMPDSLKAIAETIDIHRGYVFTRVMRFLKRRDVRMAASFGPKDLMQEGTLGLYRALTRFENDGAASFIGYARHHIDGMMLAYSIRHRTFVELPANVQQSLNQLHDIDDKADLIPDKVQDHSMSLDARRGRRLALAEQIFGEKINMGHYLDAKRREVHQDEASFRVPVADIDESNSSAVDLWTRNLQTAPATHQVNVADTKGLITRLLMQTLTPVEERIIRLRFGIGSVESDEEHDMTLREIGKTAGGSSGKPVTQERIRSIEAKAFRKLKFVITRKFGKSDENGDKYIDMAVLSSIFDIEEMR